MKYLYKKVKSNDVDVIPSNINVEIFTPKILGGLTLKGENKSFKKLVVRLMFQIITHGRARIYYATQNGELVHTSYVVPKCSKFTFMDKDDYEIGPCFTYPKYRGKGIYPTMIRYICNSVGVENSVFYMIVDEKNSSSIKGIEKAGFLKCGNVKLTKFTKRYLLEKNF